MSQDGADYPTGAVYTYQDGNEDKNHNRGTAAPANIQPGMLNSLSGDDSLHHCIVAGAQGPAIMQGDIREQSDSLLVTSAAIDLNAAPGETTLFTCPAGKSCIITKVVIRSPSAALTTASLSFGWNTANADDVISNAVPALSGVTNYKVIAAKTDAVRGAAAGTFKLDLNTAEGGALTAVFDVFGYLY